MKALNKVTVVSSNTEDSIKVEEGYVYDCNNDIYRVVLSGVVSTAILGAMNGSPILIVSGATTSKLGDDVELVSKHLKVHGTDLTEEEAGALVAKLDNVDPKDAILSKGEFAKAVAALIAGDEEFLDEVADIASEAMGGMSDKERTEFKEGVCDGIKQSAEQKAAESDSSIMDILMSQFKK
tara:strand:- start:4497 stop:5039 length:543 start_codon:yes stop_codon:yes gene_type:complete